MVPACTPIARSNADGPPTLADRAHHHDPEPQDADQQPKGQVALHQLQEAGPRHQLPLHLTGDGGRHELGAHKRSLQLGRNPVG